MSEKEDEKMAIPQERLKVDNALRKEMIKKASKKINQRYDKALKLISKN
ncbi:hypothetical protein [Robertmurraya siralis]|nr:hypothetical protein [Robertmurraya siralis]